MDSSPLSSQTVKVLSPIPAQQSLDLSFLPPIFVSPTHFELEDLHKLEDHLIESGAALTYDITEARIVLSRVERKRRAQFDLQSKGLWTEEVQPVAEPLKLEADDHLHSRKRRKVVEQAAQAREQAVVIDDSSTESEGEKEVPRTPESPQIKVETIAILGGPVQLPAKFVRDGFVWTDSNTVKVLRVDWFEQSLKQGIILPIQEYLTYEGRQVSRPNGAETPSATSSPTEPKNISGFGVSPLKKAGKVRTILERARADAPKSRTVAISQRHHGPRKFGQTMAVFTGAAYDHGTGSSNSQYAHLLHQTTSEYDSGASSDLPEMPHWVKAHVKYACQRTTLADGPNESFLDLLKKIKLARLLTNDEIGVRAYSTSMAAIAAYPYKIGNPREILALPGCDVKIANLFVEYANTGGLQAASDADSNEELKVLRLFYEIWGVGATTAREFYHDRGWRDLDDVVEFGWSTLSRVQQIGVKYYDEFLDPIPRAEVETIASIIHRHAVKVRDEGVQSLLVGGYRRGKELCGDVDIIVSHPDESQTLDIVTDIVASLEDEGWITHTLLLALTSTQRGQQTLPYRTGSGGHGFDTLDKALVVWQDPVWATQQTDLARDPKAKNPNIHRRVDIIVSPWRTVGCAVAGWSGGTTFQRDIRRYAKNVKGWKFDSSGIRSRTSGLVVDVERYDGELGKGGRAMSMDEAERRVFEGLGLEWREPWERCTG